MANTFLFTCELDPTCTSSHYTAFANTGADPHESVTAESVGEGHPDKIADQISDAILDACLAEDPWSKVACETATKTGLVGRFRVHNRSHEFPR